jgi:UDP-glucose 4-epimerase
MELARLVHELCDTSQPLNLKIVPYASFGGKYEDVPRRIPDITRAREVLGFAPRVGIEDGLAATIQWQRVAMGLD